MQWARSPPGGILRSGPPGLSAEGMAPGPAPGQQAVPPLSGPRALAHGTGTGDRRHRAAQTHRPRGLVRWHQQESRLGGEKGNRRVCGILGTAHGQMLEDSKRCGTQPPRPQTDRHMSTAGRQTGQALTALCSQAWAALLSKDSAETPKLCLVLLLEPHDSPSAGLILGTRKRTLLFPWGGY